MYSYNYTMQSNLSNPVYCSVPGPVHDVVVTPALRAIQLNWSTPLLCNGILLSYEVSYSLNGEVVTANTSSLARWLMIGSLLPLTTLHNVSVSAYTSVGRGEAVVLPGVDTFFRKSFFLFLQEVSKMF